MERLQKFLAKAGVASRRGAEELIRQGRIKVNDRIINEMGHKINPLLDKVAFDDNQVEVKEKIYLLLNKPKGYVTTLSDPQGRPIVTDLLKNISTRIFPVGRLDLDTEGALLMTNDGSLTNYILHPKYEVNKTYEALVRGKPIPNKLNQLEQGILLEGKKTWPAKIRILKTLKNETLIEVIIHEGKKRQVRKMFQAIGHPVVNLKRTAYGRLKLGDLKSGNYRFLTQKDIKMLFSGKIPFTIKNIPA